MLAESNNNMQAAGTGKKPGVQEQLGDGDSDEAQAQNQTRVQVLSEKAGIAPTQELPRTLQQISRVLEDMQEYVASLQISTTRSFPGFISPDMRTKIIALEALAKTLVVAAEVKEFTLFPKLPIELRQMIFKAALHKPQVFEVIASLDWTKTGQIIHNSSLPALLHVNREARDISLKRFDTPLSAKSYWGDGTYDEKSPAKFGCTKDIIFIPYNDGFSWNQHEVAGGSTRTSAWTKSARENLKHLALDWRVFDKHKRHSSLLNVTQFKNLETLTVVIHELHGQSPGYDDRCREMGGLRNKEPIEFMNHSGGEFVENLMPEFCQWLVAEKNRVKLEEEIDWKIPEVTIKYLTRGGKKCCSKRVPRPTARMDFIVQGRL